MNLKDNEHIKIQGICGKGFWLRYLANNKIYAEEFIHSNCIFEGEHFVNYFDAKITSLVEHGRPRIGKADKFEGSLIAYKNTEGRPNGFPVFDLETHIEHFYTGENEPDEATKLIYSAQNKLHAISALFQSAMADLEQLSDVHFDDNGKELAWGVVRKLEKLVDDFEEKVFEPCGDWTVESLSGVLYKLTRDGHQVMVLPEFRRSYLEDISRGNEMASQEELDSWINRVRYQFKLSENWK